MTSEPRKKGSAAAAAMDALDDADTSAEAPERPDAVARYRTLPAVTAAELAEHVRGGPRIIDGETHQLWEWTNGDVARCVRPVLAERFPDTAGRELADDQGFDAEGNRVGPDPAGDHAVVARATDRFNDVLRNIDGSRRYGSGRGLEIAEVQLLRTRYHRLELGEANREREAAVQRRFDRRLGIYIVLLLLIVAAVSAGFVVDFLTT